MIVWQEDFAFTSVGVYFNLRLPVCGGTPNFGGWKRKRGTPVHSLKETNSLRNSPVNANVNCD